LFLESVIYCPYIGIYQKIRVFTLTSLKHQSDVHKYVGIYSINERQHNRNDCIGIMTGRLTNRGSIPDKDGVSLLQAVQTGSGTHTASYSTYTSGSFPRCEADRTRSYASTLPYFFVALCLTTKITVPVQAEL
jgi:hypothetical protein